jgi:two-component system LytT family response regulator
MSQKNIRTLIVDDEPMARQGLRLLLRGDPGIEIVGEAGSGTEAVAAILEERPDLVFLDIQIPDPNGFQVVAQVAAEHLPAVIFCTAYDQYAIQAFEINAIDYLLKPFSDARFRAALARAKEEMARSESAGLATKLNSLIAQLAAPPPPPDRILLKSGGEIVFLKPEEIEWIEAEGDYMKFHVGGRTHLLRETMARLEAKLDPKRFARIHRSIIVNLHRVKKLMPSFAGEYTVLLEDGTKLRLSRGYHGHVKELLAQTL